MTPNEIVTEGLQKLGVVAAGEVPSGDEMTDGISLFNAMCHSLELDGIPLKHYDASSGDTLPYPQNHKVPFVYNFAVFASGDYEVQVPASVAVIASEGLRALRNAYLDPNMKLRADPALLYRNDYFNITTGE